MAGPPVRRERGQARGRDRKPDARARLPHLPVAADRGAGRLDFGQHTAHLRREVDRQKVLQPLSRSHGPERGQAVEPARMPPQQPFVGVQLDQHVRHDLKCGLRPAPLFLKRALLIARRAETRGPGRHHRRTRRGAGSGRNGTRHLQVSFPGTTRTAGASHPSILPRILSRNLNPDRPAAKPGLSDPRPFFRKPVQPAGGLRRDPGAGRPALPASGWRPPDARTAPRGPSRRPLSEAGRKLFGGLARDQHLQKLPLGLGEGGPVPSARFADGRGNGGEPGLRQHPRHAQTLRLCEHLLGQVAGHEQDRPAAVRRHAIARASPSSPFIPGMTRSSRTTSKGPCAAIRASASGRSSTPSGARSGSRARRPRISSRTSGWSSATSTERGGGTGPDPWRASGDEAARAGPP